MASADGKSPGLVVDRSTVPVSGTVQVDVKVVEISKTVLKEIGLNFYRNNGGFAFGTFSPSSLTKATFTPGVGTVVDSVSPISSAFNLLLARCRRASSPT
jgi:pilus assembly protein CpaC